VRTDPEGGETAESGTPSFEEALARLEDIVNRLERGEITLDESMTAFQEGNRLVRHCLDRLSQAEEQVQKLISADGRPAVRPLDGDGGGASG